MVNFSERLLVPVIGGVAGWLMGRFEGHGTGFQAYVRYMAALLFGLLSIFVWHDKLGLSADGVKTVCVIWTVVVGYVGWHRHLK
jgi:hypothetical protein